MTHFITREQIEAIRAKITDRIHEAGWRPPALASQKAAPAPSGGAKQEDLVALAASAQTAVDRLREGSEMIAQLSLKQAELLKQAYACIEAHGYVLSAVVRAHMKETGETPDRFAEQLLSDPNFLPQSGGVESIVRALVGGGYMPPIIN
jgi:hypothetical protein